jgi:hypothetical protein
MITILMGCPDPLAGEESVLNALLRSKPKIERVGTAGKTLRIRLSSRGNEAVLELLP